MDMKHATEYVRGLHFKLCIMGIPLDIVTYVYGDNQSVLTNMTAPDSQLKKKSNSIAYHHVCEGIAKDEWRTTYINTNENPAYMMTKSLMLGPKRDTFFCMLLHHIVGESSLPIDSAAAVAALSVAKEWINLIVKIVKHCVCNYAK